MPPMVSRSRYLILCSLDKKWAKRARGLAHAEIAAGAGDVLDVKLFAELLRQFLRNQPSDDVGDASGRERHDDLHRLAWILLGKSRARNNERRSERDNASAYRHLLVPS